MTEAHAIELLRAYHAAALACQDYRRANPDAATRDGDVERERLARLLDRTRRELLEAGRAPWDE